MPPSVIGSSKSAKIPWPTRAQRAALTSQIALALALIFPGLGECFIWQRLGGFRFCFFMLLVRPIYDISVEVHSFETSGSWFSCVPLPGKLHSLHPRKVIIYSKRAKSTSVFLFSFRRRHYGPLRARVESSSWKEDKQVPLQR